VKSTRIECGAAKPSQADAIALNVHGQGKNVNLRIDYITRAMVANVPDLLIDLLEIAAYVYCADQRVTRGGPTLANFAENWRRNMHFTIPVRELAVWKQQDVQRLLAETLGFLSDDSYAFEFRQAKNPFSPRDLYFDKFIDVSADHEVVAMFSGGLDSFAGALQDLVLHQRSVCLVGHFSSPKVRHVQEALIDRLKARGLERRIAYMPVWVTNESSRPIDFSQRSRSFLFACLGLVIARMSGKDSITFYENGVVSINPPMAGDVVGGRATRTTHPQVFRRLEELFSLLLERSITIENPLQWMTKSEVAGLLRDADMVDALALTNSCTRPYRRTKEHPHCGECSQCIDRRFGILAAGLGAYEPASNYKVDLLTADRSTSDDRRMAVSYVSFFRKVVGTSSGQFLAEFPEVVAALDHFPGLSREEARDRIYDLLQRHASAVQSVITTGVRDHATDLARSALPPGSLLALCVTRSGGEQPPPDDVDRQMREFFDQLSAPAFEFAIDETGRRVVFRGGTTLTEANFRVVEELLPGFRSAKRGGSEVPFMPPPTLADCLGITEPNLRTRLLRLRKALDPLAIELGLPLDENSFIENRPRSGYRLNPALRELSLADIHASTIPGKAR
jgi:hypothetical protein